MSDYYKKVKGNLSEGQIAYARDINLVQTNISDAFKAAITDHHENTSFILGNKEDAFKLTPAPKRLGRYIDTMNLVESENEEWLSIRKWSYRQIIKKSKTSLYSIICKFRNLSNEPVTVWCRLEDRNGDKYSETNTSVTIPANTESAEFEIVFDVKYIPTALGLSHEQVEAFDSKYMAPPLNETIINSGIDHIEEIDSIDNFSIGANELYFIVDALNINETDIAQNGDEDNIITDESFAILADRTGGYGQLLEKGQKDFSKTKYDLYFKDIYATTSTYLCEPGEAIINGSKVMCADTHISIAGANDYGNVDTYVYMNEDGHLRAVNSPAYFEKNTAPVDLPASLLPIAIITTYMNDVKQPIMYQDDTSLRVRPRSHHERLRRLEKKVEYLDDIAIPARLKYTLSGIDLVNENPEGEIGQIDNGNFYLTTNSKGDAIIRSTKSEVIDIPITLKEEDKTVQVVEGTTDTNVLKDLAPDDIANATQLANIQNLEHDREKGTLQLKTITEETETTTTSEESTSQTTDVNPWEGINPTGEFEPIEREYTTTRSFSEFGSQYIPIFTENSEFPAMLFNIEKDYELHTFTVPITKFKNCQGVAFFFCKVEGSDTNSNDLKVTNNFSIGTQIYTLEGAKEKDGYQIMENGITINFSQPAHLKAGKYVLIANPVAKSGQGSCFINTYKVENPKNYCLRFYGKGNMYQYSLKETYSEVWYNSCKFTGKESKLATEGSVTSKTITWDAEEPIIGIIADANITTPENCSYELYADTGGGFQKLELGKTTNMTGGGMSFKWKLVLKGKGGTPVLSYNDKKKYAISFKLTRKQPDIGTYSDTNDCITTKTFKAEEILKEYIGDDSFNPENKFSNYEFVRLWGDDINNENLNFVSQIIVDVAGSNETASITYPVTTTGSTATNTVTQHTVNTDIFSFIYADLTLNDFNTTSVDYSNYDPYVEYDEHNLRLKLDTEHSYNDSNISLYSLYSFDTKKQYYETNGVTLEHITLESDEDEDYDYVDRINFTQDISPTENQVIFKLTNDPGINLTPYTGIQLRLKLFGTPTDEEVLTAIKGLGLYISSANEEDVPTFNDETIENIEVISGVETLPNLNLEKQENIDKYYGKIIKDEQTINGVTYVTYFKYIKKDGKYELQQVHNLKSYVLYQLPDISFSTNRKTENISETDSLEVSTIYIPIDLDQQNINLSKVKEIGLITLVKEGRYQVNQSCSLRVDIIKGIKDDYVSIYNPETDKEFNPFRNDLAGDTNHYTSILQTQTVSNGEKPQKRCRLDVYYNRIAGDGEILAYYPIQKSFVNYKHMSVQLAANCWIPKNALELHLCSDAKGKESVFSLRIPTLNTIHNPTTSTVTSGKDDGFVKFSQIFKKINKDITIRSISIRATARFKEYMQQIRVSDASGYISLYIGKIILYKAETIPMFYKNIRMKIYDNNQIEGGANFGGIRKVGCVIEYK